MRTSLHDARDVPAVKVKPLIEELVRRCGNTRAAASYAGISRTTLHYITSGKHDMVYKKTARLIILALYQKRKEDRRNGSSERFNAAIKRQAIVEERLERLTGY